MSMEEILDDLPDVSKYPENPIEWLLNASKQFQKVIEYPTKGNTFETILNKFPERKDEIVQHVEGTRIIASQDIISLIQNFLSIKRESTQLCERELYKDMTVDQFITRVFAKRPLFFYTSHDIAMLRSLNGAVGDTWLSVGKDEGEEEGDISLKQYMSYDEMAISALIGLSTPAFFINPGSRDNAGRVAQQGTFNERGIYVGLVGARFERPRKMESLFCVVSKDYNIPKYGFGLENICEDIDLRRYLIMWATFYDQYKVDSYGNKVYCWPTYDEVRQLEIESNEEFSKRHVITNYNDDDDDDEHHDNS
eukprot:TRINITY_DN2108_c0_g2_i3.p1 TRINITY_DN2108_c0_g2~~TRINITY_DN2108_c0_g2_i3.p1  ORF type:complete len:308 (-),score=66.52 TRINITY_DN2108_c0_g2_i3:20-943(-)